MTQLRQRILHTSFCPDCQYNNIRPVRQLYSAHHRSDDHCSHSHMDRRDEWRPDVVLSTAGYDFRHSRSSTTTTITPNLPFSSNPIWSTKLKNTSTNDVYRRRRKHDETPRCLFYSSYSPSFFPSSSSSCGAPHLATSTLPVCQIRSHSLVSQLQQQKPVSMIEISQNLRFQSNATRQRKRRSSLSSSQSVFLLFAIICTFFIIEMPGMVVGTTPNRELWHPHPHSHRSQASSSSSSLSSASASSPMHSLLHSNGHIRKTKHSRNYPQYGPASSPSSSSSSNSAITSMHRPNTYVSAHNFAAASSQHHQHHNLHNNFRPARVAVIPDAQANLNQYLNMMTLSVAPQHLFQHQMLPHHSTLPYALSHSGPAAASANAISAVRGGASSVNKPLGLESNSLAAISPNSIRSKGPKWWDGGARSPSSSIGSHMAVAQSHMVDGRHANAILPASSSSASATNANINLPLRKKQRRLVMENPGALDAVLKGMRMAVTECQTQLKAHRWNCPVNGWKKGKQIFGKIIKTGCRETAFVYALTSAAVAHAVARYCSEGLIETCTCDSSPNREIRNEHEWQWGGCSDNIKFGYKFARSFVDAAERDRDQRSHMNLHNNEAGRLLVSKQMRRECKCHGMSGSCALKTCWMRLASFNEIGHDLKERFDVASRVKMDNEFRHYGRNKYKFRKKIPLETYEKGYPKPTETDLIYYEESPDFCTPNSKYGLFGTKGRECNASSISVDSCDLVCCNRGYTTEEIELTERCNCTFRWCCEVSCSICKVKKQVHRCK